MHTVAVGGNEVNHGPSSSAGMRFTKEKCHWQADKRRTPSQRSRLVDSCRLCNEDRKKRNKVRRLLSAACRWYSSQLQVNSSSYVLGCVSYCGACRPYTVGWRGELEEGGEIVGWCSCVCKRTSTRRGRHFFINRSFVLQTCPQDCFWDWN